MSFSAEEIAIRRENIKRRKAQGNRLSRYPDKNILLPETEDPSVQIQIRQSNLERLKNLHHYHSDNKTLTYDDLLTNLFGLINDATGRKDKF